jgi:hypothetical protein
LASADGFIFLHVCRYAAANEATTLEGVEAFRATYRLARTRLHDQATLLGRNRGGPLRTIESRLHRRIDDIRGNVVERERLAASVAEIEAALQLRHKVGAASRGAQSPRAAPMLPPAPRPLVSLSVLGMGTSSPRAAVRLEQPSDQPPALRAGLRGESGASASATRPPSISFPSPRSRAAMAGARETVRYDGVGISPREFRVARAQLWPANLSPRTLPELPGLPQSDSKGGFSGVESAKARAAVSAAQLVVLRRAAAVAQTAER